MKKSLQTKKEQLKTIVDVKVKKTMIRKIKRTEKKIKKDIKKVTHAKRKVLQHKVKIQMHNKKLIIKKAMANLRPIEKNISVLCWRQGSGFF
jgi:hypothetical protein